MDKSVPAEKRATLGIERVGCITRAGALIRVVMTTSLFSGMNEVLRNRDQILSFGLRRRDFTDMCKTWSALLRHKRNYIHSYTFVAVVGLEAMRHQLSLKAWFVRKTNKACHVTQPFIFTAKVQPHNACQSHDLIASRVQFKIIIVWPMIITKLKLYWI